MAENKTKPTAVSVETFLNAVEPVAKREDALTLLSLFEKVTGEKAVMWGPSIVGFGSYHYIYESGREGDMCITGFSPRKANLVIYVSHTAKEEGLLEKLGKHKSSKGCLYINRLTDLNLTVLEEMIKISVREVKKKYPTR